jgi:Fic family protein
MDRARLSHAVRQTLKRLPAPHDNAYGVVPSPPPEGATALGDQRYKVDAALHAISRIDNLAATLGEPYYISRILARQEAIKSSSIEGTNSTLSELLNAEEEIEEGTNDTRQVYDYALLLERLVPQANERREEFFELTLIGDIHYELMKSNEEYKDHPGHIRTGTVWIGGARTDISRSIFNPPPADEIESCLSHQISYLRLEGMQAMTQSIVEHMAIAHAHFEAIHPFTDGNGRTGRAMLPLIMAAQGHTPLYLSPYIEANKRIYGECLQDAQQRLNWVPIIGFMAEAIVETASHIEATHNALQTLRMDWVERRKYRRNSAALRALELLPRYPMLTVSRLQSMLGISAPTANQAVDQLMEVNILKERTGYKRNRVFVASEVLEIINRPFGESTVGNS